MILTPDGVRYLRMGYGLDEPMPFRLRRGLPQLCRVSADRWVLANVVSMIYAAAGIGVLAAQHGGTLAQSVLAAALFVGLPWVRFCARRPVLVDMPALALAVLAAVAFPVSPVAAVGLCIAGAVVCERVPIWAALFAWEPLLLVGLVAPVFAYLTSPATEIDDADPLADTLRHPLRTGLAWHRKLWLSPAAMLLPWGFCLIAVLNPSPWLFAALAAGYAQLLFATDTVRLYQQSAPVVCVAAATAFPLDGVSALCLASAAAVAHYFNPFGGKTP